MEDLKKKRTVLKGKFTQCENKIQAAPKDNDNDQTKIVKILLLEMGTLIKKIEAIQEKIEEIDSTDYVKDYEYIFNLKLKLESFRSLSLSEDKPVDNRTPHQIPVPSNNDGWKPTLPKITLPTFDGRASEWQSFWDIFTTTIHQHPRLGDIEKFTYLKTQLRGPALSAIQGLASTSANYGAAIAILQQRFGQNFQVINEHMESLLNLFEPTYEPVSFRKFSDSVEAHINGLEALGKSSSSFGDLLTPVLYHKLPAQARQNLTRDKGDINFDLSELREALKKEAKVLESATVPPTNNSGSDWATAAFYLNQDRPKPYNNNFVSNQPTTTYHQPNLYQNQSRNSLQQAYQPSAVRTCPFCNQTHSPSECHLDVDSRCETIKQKRLCFNCLGPHKASRCHSKFTCRICRAHHHSALHGAIFFNVLPSSRPRWRTDSQQWYPPPVPSQTQNPGPGQNSSEQWQQPHVDSSQQRQNSGPGQMNNTGVHIGIEDINPYQDSKKRPALLKSAVTIVATSKAHTRANILFDDGSQRSFVTKPLADFLGLTPVRQELMNFATFGAKPGQPQRLDVGELHLRALTGEWVGLEVVIIPTIATPMNLDFRQNILQFDYLRQLPLAHPIAQYRTETLFEIDVLIGSDQYWNFVGDHIIRGSGPTAIASRLGYLVSGPIPTSGNSHSVTVNILNLTINPEPESDKPSSLSELATDTVQRLPDGSYSASIPWKTCHPCLPNNLAITAAKTRSLVQNLRPDLLQIYDGIIREYEARDFIEKIPEGKLAMISSHHYIHHFPVVKASATTPIRIVFNCSFHTADNPSLNDCVEPGPPLINDLVDILVRFRLHQIALSSDIEKAFLHVKIAESDRDYLRFWWIGNLQDVQGPLRAYRFKVAPFGLACSPFMLLATLDVHLKSVNSSVTADMRRNLYMDNILTGCNTISNALDYYEEAKAVLKSANFTLRSWTSNEPELRHRFHSDQCADESNIVNILGLLWNTNTDNIVLQPKNLNVTNHPPTKRDVLQTIGKVYDPLGHLLPIVIRARLFFQYLCRDKRTWNDRLDETEYGLWCAIVDDIHTALHSYSIPRKYFSQPNNEFLLHVFVDASQHVYGTVAFVSSSSESTRVVAKAHLTPLNVANTTIPRLELRAALLGAKLAETLKNSLSIPSESVRLWSDSQIVLYWIGGHTGPKTKSDCFIRKRVVEINQTIPQSLWGYVPTSENPADLLTRGTNVDTLSSPLWERGPPWLNNKSAWPVWSEPTSTTEPTKDTNIEQTEFTNITATTLINQESQIDHKPCITLIMDLDNYGSYQRLLTVTALVLRFITNCRIGTKRRVYGPPQQRTRSQRKLNVTLLVIGFVSKCRVKHERRIQGPVSVEEYQNSEQTWYRAVQSTAYPAVQEFLRKRSSRAPTIVHQLGLFLDRNGVIRSNGRIHNANIDHDTKFPFLLPAGHRLTELYVRHCHSKSLHSGLASTVTMIRQRVWIPNIRQYVKKVLWKCVTCKKVMGKPYPIPAPPPLPKLRVQDASPFTITGVDFSGAIPIRGENNTIRKAYICLFTCATTRNVHLELVTDMSTETFLLAFRRFVARRSLPQVMMSDNASTFLAAAEEVGSLTRLMETKRALADLGTTWKFIPKRAPWFGGWWERMVGITKTCLKKCIGKSRCDFDTLHTLLVEIENVVNHRPLTYIHSNDAGPEILTPAHLLHGRHLNLLPHQDPIDVNDPEWNFNRDFVVTKSTKLKNLLNDFSTRWKLEYLTSLREYHRDSGNNKQTICEGDVVQIHDEGPRVRWKLAVIEKCVRGGDGYVRSAVVRTADGVTNRPIAKLYPLEVRVPLETGTVVKNNESEPDVEKSEPENRTEDNGEMNPNTTTTAHPQRAAAKAGRNQVKRWISDLNKDSDSD